MNTITGAVILAGGHSERMNFPKAFLRFEGRTFIQYLAETYIRSGVSRIALVINHQFCTPAWAEYLEPLAALGVLVPNTEPDKGRIHSIRLGLENLNGVGRCFIQPTDSSLLPDSLQAMLSCFSDSGYVVPSYNGKNGHPVLISKRVINAIRSQTETVSSLRDILSGFERNVAEVDDDRVLWNINTPDDYRNCIRTSKAAHVERCISKNK